MTYYTYILYSKTHDRFYYGQTQEISQRVEKHNKGQVTSTKAHLPWKLYAYKEVNTRAEAMMMEKKLKNLKCRKRVEEFIEKNNFVII